MLNYYICGNCDAQIPGVYFSYAQIRKCQLDPVDRPECMGCMISDYLDIEEDHYKMHKRSIIKRWLYYAAIWNDAEEKHGSWNETDLSKAIKDFNDKGVVEAARKLDEQRKRDMQQRDDYDPIDHECHEIQRPLPVETGGRRGVYGIQAPTTTDKAVEKSCEQWAWFRADRINAHGQPATLRGR